MKTKLIATCGISILNNSRDLKDEISNKNWGSLDESEFNKIIDSIDKRLADLDIKDKRFGAEINSILNLILDNKFSKGTLYLIASETIEGKYASELIKKILIDKLEIKTVEIITIEHLSVKNEFDFAKKGLKNLVVEICKLVKGNENDIAISPIGGLKAQIFMTGLVAQIFKITAYYMYEGFDKIIELLPLPISIDLEFFSRNIEIISKLNAEEILDEREIKDHMKKEPLLRNILEKEHVDGVNYMSLSALGQMIYEKYYFESMSKLPKASLIAGKNKKFITKNNEAHAEVVLNQSDFKRFKNMLLEKEYIEKVVTNYYTPDNKGNIISYTKSSNSTEGRVIKVRYNCNQGTLGLVIYLTENKESHVDAAIIDLYETIKRSK